MLLVVAVVAVVVLAAILTVRALDGSGPTATFVEPTLNANVRGDGIPVSGHSSNLPDRATLWLAVRGVEQAATYQPQPRPCVVRDEGEWQCEVAYVGGPDAAGKQYQLVVLLVDQRAIDAFVEYDRTKVNYQGMALLPPGAAEIGRTTVTRV